MAPIILHWSKKKLKYYIAIKEPTIQSINKSEPGPVNENQKDKWL